MARVAAGDEAAFRCLAEAQLARVLALARRMLGVSAEAEDVAQEVLLRLWRHAGRWQAERGRVATWLYAITARLCLDRLRGAQLRSAELRSARSAASEEALAAAPDPAPDALAGLQAREEQARVGAAVGALPPRQRAALALFYYEGLDGEAAARALGLRPRAFWSLLHRARLGVRQGLAGREGEDP